VPPRCGQQSRKRRDERRSAGQSPGSLSPTSQNRELVPPCPKSKRSFDTLHDPVASKVRQSIGQDETGCERKAPQSRARHEPGGIHDPYNRGAYLGSSAAVRELGIRGRVLTPAPKEGYVPSLSLLARQKYDLVIGNNRLCRPRDRQSRHRVPDTRFAHHRRRPRRSGAAPEERRGPPVQRRASRLSCGHLAALVLTLSRGEEVISSVGGQRVPAVEKVHRRLRGGRARSQSSRHDVERLYR